MDKFKVGDKVKVTESIASAYVGDIYTSVKECRNSGVWIDYKNREVNCEDLNAYYKNYFKLIEEKPMFDMKKDKWFIRTPTPEISEAVQLWLYAQDFEWRSEGQFIQYTKETALGYNWGLGFGDPEFYLEESFKEIKLTFKTIIDTITYPQIETEREKNIRELKETIEKSRKQIEELEND